MRRGLAANGQISDGAIGGSRSLGEVLSHWRIHDTDIIAVARESSRERAAAMDKEGAHMDAHIADMFEANAGCSDLSRAHTAPGRCRRECGRRA